MLLDSQDFRVCLVASAVALDGNATILIVEISMDGSSVLKSDRSNGAISE